MARASTIAHMKAETTGTKLDGRVKGECTTLAR